MTRIFILLFRYELSRECISWSETCFGPLDDTTSKEVLHTTCMDILLHITMDHNLALHTLHTLYAFTLKYCTNFLNHIQNTPLSAQIILIGNAVALDFCLHFDNSDWLVRFCFHFFGFSNSGLFALSSNIQNRSYWDSVTVRYSKSQKSEDRIWQASQSCQNGDRNLTQLSLS